MTTQEKIKDCLETYKSRIGLTNCLDERRFAKVLEARKAIEIVKKATKKELYQYIIYINGLEFVEKAIGSFKEFDKKQTQSEILFNSSLFDANESLNFVKFLSKTGE